MAGPDGNSMADISEDLPDSFFYSGYTVAKCYFFSLLFTPSGAALDFSFCPVSSSPTGAGT